MTAFVNNLGNKKFLAGDNVSWVDFIFLETIFHAEFSEPALTTIYPVLRQYKERVSNLPGVKEHLANPECPDGDYDATNQFKYNFTLLSTAIATEKKYIYSEKYFGSCKLATKEFP